MGGWEFVGGAFDEGAGDVSDHFVEEAVGLEFESDALRDGDDVESGEGADGVVDDGASLRFVGK